MKIITRKEQETFALAKKFISELREGATIGLIGELGAGKTAFTKGVAQALKVKTTITSPTFVLMRVYKITKHSFLKHLVHVDAYRIKKADSLKAIGLEDYIQDPASLVIIEWADLVKKILPKNKKLIYFAHGKNETRVITLPALSKARASKSITRPRQSKNPRG